MPFETPGMPEITEEDPNAKNSEVSFDASEKTPTEILEEKKKNALEIIEKIEDMLGRKEPISPELVKEAKEKVAEAEKEAERAPVAETAYNGPSVESLRKAGLDLNKKKIEKAAKADIGIRRQESEKSKQLAEDILEEQDLRKAGEFKQEADRADINRLKEISQEIGGDFILNKPSAERTQRVAEIAEEIRRSTPSEIKKYDEEQIARVKREMATRVELKKAINEEYKAFSPAAKAEIDARLKIVEKLKAAEAKELGLPQDASMQEILAKRQAKPVTESKPTSKTEASPTPGQTRVEQHQQHIPEAHGAPAVSHERVQNTATANHERVLKARDLVDLLYTYTPNVVEGSDEDPYIQQCKLFVERKIKNRWWKPWNWLTTKKILKNQFKLAEKMGAKVSEARRNKLFEIFGVKREKPTAPAAATTTPPTPGVPAAPLPSGIPGPTPH